MISAKHDFVFVHPPKTGGNTMHKIFQPYYDSGIILQFIDNGFGPGHGVSTYVKNPDSNAPRNSYESNPTVKSPERFPVNKHSTYQQFLTNPHFTDLKKLKLISAIRNPWDRAASYYRWSRSVNPFAAWYKRDKFKLRERSCVSYWSGHNPDFVLRHECFENDVTQLLYYLSIPMPDSLAEMTINVTKAIEEKDPLSYRQFYIKDDGSYDEELIEKIRLDAQADIEFSEKIFIKPYDF